MPIADAEQFLNFRTRELKSNELMSCAVMCPAGYVARL